MSDFIDRRLVKRLPSSRPVVLLLNQQSHYAVLTDFSKRGLGMLIDSEIPVNERVEVHFDVATTEGIHHFQFKAVVKHCICLHEHNHLGVQLELPSVAYQSIYESLAAA